MEWLVIKTFNLEIILNNMGKIKINLTPGKSSNPKKIPSHFNSCGNLTYRGRQARIKLASQGLPINEIADMLFVSRQAVDYFIRDNGLYETWKKNNEILLSNRNKPTKEETLEKQRRSALESIASQINEVLLRTLDSGPNSQKKAYDLSMQYLGDSPKVYTFNFLFDFYSHVNDLIKRKKSFSYGDLAKKFSVHASAARRILVSAGLKSSNEPRARNRLSEEQKKAVRQGLDNTSWGYYDIGHFAGTSHVTVRAEHDRGPNGRVVSTQDLFFSDFGCLGRVTPRRASQIYELLEIGASYLEVKKELKIGDEVLYDAVEKRGRYSETIMDNLRKMYPDREIIRPYL